MFADNSIPAYIYKETINFISGIKNFGDKLIHSISSLIFESYSIITNYTSLSGRVTKNPPKPKITHRFLDYGNKTTYTGTTIDVSGKPIRHGLGKMAHKGDISLEAAASERDSYSTIKMESGWEYSGTWKSDKRHGFGTMKYQNGQEYTGEWTNDKRKGWGTMTYPNGDIFVGKWIDHNVRGTGKIVYTSGSEIDFQGDQITEIKG